MNGKIVNRDLTTIVIVWSGETRTHNKNAFDSICRIYSPHYKIIHVGHTWEHCKTPCSIEHFEHFSKTDQSEMVDFMKKDRNYFPNIRPSKKEVREYHWNTPDEYVKLHGEIFKMMWGQVWGHFLAMQLCKKLENRHNIVGYVRMRWDIESPLYNKATLEYIENHDRLLDFYPHDEFAWAKELGIKGTQDHYDNVMKRISKKINTYANDRIPQVITDDWMTHEPSGMNFGHLWLNDLHWIHVNSMAHKDTGNERNVGKETIETYPTPEKLVSDILGDNFYHSFGRNNFPNVHPSAHTLWAIVFDYMNFHTSGLIPNEIQFIDRSNDSNKPWKQNPFGV